MNGGEKEMFDRFKLAIKVLKESRKADTSPKSMATLAVGILLLGVLVPVGLTAWEDYVPTDPTLLVVWPIAAVIIVIAIALKFL